MSFSSSESFLAHSRVSQCNLESERERGEELAIEIQVVISCGSSAFLIFEAALPESHRQFLTCRACSCGSFGSDENGSSVKTLARLCRFDENAKETQ